MTTTNTDPRAMARAVVADLTGPGGQFELAEDDVLGARLPVFTHRRSALHEVLAESVLHGDRDYIVTADSRLTFREHASQVASLARALREDHGVRPGDRVAIAAANSPEWIVTFWATVSIGAVCVGYNAWWSKRELAYGVEHATPTVIVADAKRVLLLEGCGVPVLSIETDIPRLCAQYPGEPLPSCDVAEDDPAIILYTSGTSGRPKGATHSHRNVLAVADYHRMNDSLAAAFHDPIEPRDRTYLMVLPLFHIASLHNLTVPRLANGSRIALHRGGFDVERVLTLIQDERVTNWGAVPTMANRLLEYGDLSSFDLSSLTAFSLASAPSSPAFQKRLREGLPFATNALVDSYGLTESSTAISVATTADLAEDPGTLGYPIVGVQLEIRDTLGNAVPDGVEGEICVRSAYTMLGYWNDPSATADAIDADRWLRTGDIGVLRDGRIRLSSRRSDLIIRGGENVYPAEIEGVLMEHPLIRECIVLGVPHEDLGQEVAAVIVSDEPLLVEDLCAFAGERLGHFKVPTQWRFTNSPLPRNATGKVIRRDVSV